MATRFPAACASRADSLIVEAHCVNVTAFDASNFGPDQRRTITEIVGAILRPDLKLPVVGGQCQTVLLALVGRCQIPACGVGQRGIELVFCRFEQLRR